MATQEWKAERGSYRHGRQQQQVAGAARVGESYQRADQMKHNYLESCTASSQRTRGKTEQLKQGTSIGKEAAHGGCGLRGNWDRKQG